VFLCPILLLSLLLLRRRIWVEGGDDGDDVRRIFGVRVG
jgi:hypothetical protein